MWSVPQVQQLQLPNASLSAESWQQRIFAAFGEYAGSHTLKRTVNKSKASFEQRLGNIKSGLPPARKFGNRPVCIYALYVMKAAATAHSPHQSALLVPTPSIPRTCSPFRPQRGTQVSTAWTTVKEKREGPSALRVLADGKARAQGPSPSMIIVDSAFQSRRWGREATYIQVCLHCAKKMT